MSEADAAQTAEVATAPVTGMSHVQLLVADVQASRRWYETVLGMERFAGGPEAGYVALRHRPSGIGIVLSPRGERPVEAASPLDHLAFSVPDGERLARWAEHLRKVGVDHPGIVMELGKPSLQLRDPDGNAIELVAPPVRSQG